MPLSCQVAPPSQRELHKDGGGGGGSVARRARAARAPKAKSCTIPFATPSTTPCAASFGVLAAAAAVVVVREGAQMYRRRRAPVAAHARNRGSTTASPSTATGR